METLRLKYFQHPIANNADWIARNPTLKQGEVGYAFVVYNNKTIVRKKVGPGAWNTLQWHVNDIWEDETPVNNPIGDVSDNLAGKSAIEILDEMLNIYKAPVLLGGINDGGEGLSNFANSKIIEIGNSIVNPILVNYTLNNPENLQGSSPINVTAEGVFDNEDSFPVGQVTLTHSSPITATAVRTIPISIQAVHATGVSNTIKTYINFYPKIIYGVSAIKDVTPSSIMSMVERNTIINDNYKRDYNFSNSGYSVVCIPSMLPQQNLIFTDIGNPVAPANYAMDNMGTLVIDNGVTTYSYQIYVSTFYLNTSGKLRIS